MWWNTQETISKGKRRRFIVSLCFCPMHLTSDHRILFAEFLFTYTAPISGVKLWMIPMDESSWRWQSFRAEPNWIQLHLWLFPWVSPTYTHLHNSEKCVVIKSEKVASGAKGQTFNGWRSSPECPMKRLERCSTQTGACCLRDKEGFF